MEDRASRRRKLVLTVDDDESIRTTLRMALEMGGFDVMEAAEGNEALALLHAAEELPSSILTDWNMPCGMGGRAFLESVKRDPALANIPVVVVSGTADQSALKMGAARVINKPFDLDALLTVVESVCGGDDAPRGLATQRNMVLVPRLAQTLT